VAHYDADFSGFEADLAKGPWDLVIFADDSYVVSSSTLAKLRAYVAGGGRLALHSWQVSAYPADPLWADLGVRFVADDPDPPDPVHWWDPAHPAVTIPEQVPELTRLNAGMYQIYGQHVEALAGTEAVAGYTTAPRVGEAALVIGNGGRTAFRGFVDGQNDADLDTDGVRDGVELWVDLVSGLTQGFARDVPWLGEDPAHVVVKPGTAATVTVTVDATSLTPGRYQAELLVMSDDPRHRSIRVPVTVDVTGPPGPGPGLDLS
jgi:hypothetical protein